MRDKHFLRNYIVFSDGGIKSRFSHRTLRSTKMKNGYLQVTLYDGEGNHKKFLVHRLVAITHLPNPQKLPQVNHLDMDKTNNHVSNLEWCSSGDNIRHARKYGPNIYTPERNRKISESRKGVPRSKETREKLSRYWTGKMSGKNNPMYGKRLTPLQIQKRTHSRYHKGAPVDGCPFCLSDD